MNQIFQKLAVACCCLAVLSAIPSCKKYSPDEPFPDVYEPSVFVGSNNKIVYSLNPETGERKWKLPVNGEVHATPIIVADALWVGTGTGTLYKINYKDGNFIDSLTFAGAIEGTPMPYNDNLLVPAGNALIYLNSQSLDTIWYYDMGGTIMSSPAVHAIPEIDDQAIFLSGVNNKVVALDQGGSEIWQYTAPTAGAFFSSPCVVNDSFLYVGNDNGNVYALFTHTGQEKWIFPTTGQVRSSPISIGGNILVGSNDRNLYSIDSATGLERWHIQTSDQIVSSPAVHNQYVYFGSYDGYVYCVDIIQGEIEWKKPTFGLIKASPTIVNGALYIGSFDKNLYKLRTDDGSQIWVKNIEGQMETSPIIDTIGGTAMPSISGLYRW